MTLKLTNTEQLTNTEMNRRQLPAPPSNHDLLQIGDIVAFLSFVWQHKFRIMLGLVVVMELGAVYYIKSPRVYESTAKVMVVKKSPVMVEGRTGIPLNTDAMSTHIALIESPWLAERVLADPRAASWETFADAKTPVSLLAGSLTVDHEMDHGAPVSTSNILNLAFKGPHPEDAAVVLGAVIDSYRQYLQDSNRIVNQDALSLIAEKSEQIDERLGAMQKESETLRIRISELEDNRKNLDEIEIRLAAIDTQRLELATRRSEIEFRLKALRDASQNGRDPATLRAMLPKKVDRNPHGPYSTVEEKLLPLLAKERANEFGSSHPYTRELRTEIELIRELFSQPSRLSHELDQERTEREILFQRSIFLKELEQEIAVIAAVQQALNGTEAPLIQQARTEREKAAEQSRLELKEEQLRISINQDQHYRNELSSQLLAVDIGMMSGGYQATTIAPPDMPKQVAPQLLMVCAVSVLLGLVGGFLYAFIGEYSNRTFRNSQEVTQSLQAPVLGNMPAPSSRGKLPRILGSRIPSLCADNWSTSTAAEAYRALRTSLFVQTDDERLRVIQIASPNDGDGKTTLAANLAVSLAQAGKQVLLIDADLHAPQVHTLFGLSVEEGLACVLAGRCRVDEAIQSSGIAGLSVLPGGPKPSSPSDLLTSPRLKDTLDTLRQQYDYILIDTPALLSATDAQVVAVNSDAVLLAVRCTKNGQPSAARATEILRFCGAKILGVVLNDASGKTVTPVFVRTAPTKETEEMPNSRFLARCVTWLASAALQLRHRVGNISRLGARPGFSDGTVASAKTANPKIKTQRSTRLWHGVFGIFSFSVPRMWRGRGGRSIRRRPVEEVQTAARGDVGEKRGDGRPGKDEHTPRATVARRRHSPSTEHSRETSAGSSSSSSSGSAGTGAGGMSAAVIATDSSTGLVETDQSRERDVDSIFADLGGGNNRS